MGMLSESNLVRNQFKEKYIEPRGRLLIIDKDKAYILGLMRCSVWENWKAESNSGNAWNVFYKKSSCEVDEKLLYMVVWSGKKQGTGVKY